MNLGNEPENRLTRLCQAMLETMVEQDECGEDDRAIVMVSAEGEGGLAVIGYGEEYHVVIGDALCHVRALLRAMDMDFVIIPFKEPT